MPINTDCITLQDTLMAKELQPSLMLICMQITNFIFNFLFEIKERDCKLAILGTLRRLDHPNQTHSIDL